MTTPSFCVAPTPPGRCPDGEHITRGVWWVTRIKVTVSCPQAVSQGAPRAGISVAPSLIETALHHPSSQEVSVEPEGVGFLLAAVRCLTSGSEHDLLKSQFSSSCALSGPRSSF